MIGAGRVTYASWEDRIVGSLVAVALGVLVLPHGVERLLDGDVVEGALYSVAGAVGVLLALSCWRNRAVVEGGTLRVTFLLWTRTIDLATVTDWQLVPDRVYGLPRNVLVGEQRSGRPLPLGGWGLRAPRRGRQAERLETLGARLRAGSGGG